jgi:predicted transcriptional regulator
MMAAKIYLEDKKRMNIKDVKKDDRIFVDTTTSQGSIHCLVSEVEKKNGQITIHFSGVGNNPNRLVGNHRQDDVIRIALYK